MARAIPRGGSTPLPPPKPKVPKAKQKGPKSHGPKPKGSKQKQPQVKKAPKVKRQKGKQVIKPKPKPKRERGKGVRAPKYVKGHRFRWTKGIAKLYQKERFEAFNYQELAKYSMQMSRGVEDLQARGTYLRDKPIKTEADRRELTRIQNALPHLRHAANRTRDVIMPERASFVPVPRQFRANWKLRYDQKIDTRNVMVLEAAGIATQLQPTSDPQSQREMAGGVHETRVETASKLTYKGGKWKGLQAKRQKVQKITLAPYHVHAWNSDTYPLYVHTHPLRSRPGNQDWPGRSIFPRNQALRGHVKLKNISHEAESIKYDDIPSGADILNVYSRAKPSLVITPRRNILMVSRPGRPRLASLSGDPDQAETILQNLIHKADDFAWERVGASYPKSIKDAGKRLAKYVKLREAFITNAMERNAGISITFYKKGEAIRYPLMEIKTEKPHHQPKTPEIFKKPKPGEITPF